MLKYPCLVLDHDDTVVQSEKTIVFLIRNDIKSIYLANYSSKVQNCISLLKKEGIVTDNL